MLVYLDGMRSVARQPNENFARELLELFTLGEDIARKPTSRRLLERLQVGRSIWRREILSTGATEVAGLVWTEFAAG